MSPTWLPSHVASRLLGSQVWHSGPGLINILYPWAKPGRNILHQTQRPCVLTTPRSHIQTIKPPCQFFHTPLQQIILQTIFNCLFHVALNYWYNRHFHCHLLSLLWFDEDFRLKWFLCTSCLSAPGFSTDSYLSLPRAVVSSLVFFLICYLSWRQVSHLKLTSFDDVKCWLVLMMLSLKVKYWLGLIMSSLKVICWLVVTMSSLKVKC